MPCRREWVKEWPTLAMEKKPHISVGYKLKMEQVGDDWSRARAAAAQSGGIAGLVCCDLEGYV